MRVLGSLLDLAASHHAVTAGSTQASHDVLNHATSATACPAGTQRQSQVTVVGADAQ